MGFLHSIQRNQEAPPSSSLGSFVCECVQFLFSFFYGFNNILHFFCSKIHSSFYQTIQFARRFSILFSSSSSSLSYLLLSLFPFKVQRNNMVLQGFSFSCFRFQCYLQHPSKVSPYFLIRVVPISIFLPQSLWSPPGSPYELHRRIVIVMALKWSILLGLLLDWVTQETSIMGLGTM